jgi:hypothetical protein
MFGVSCQSSPCPHQELQAESIAGSRFKPVGDDRIGIAVAALRIEPVAATFLSSVV